MALIKMNVLLLWVTLCVLGATVVLAQSAGESNTPETASEDATSSTCVYYYYYNTLKYKLYCQNGFLRSLIRSYRRYFSLSES